jgi:hypothetical protein
VPLVSACGSVRNGNSDWIVFPMALAMVVMLVDCITENAVIELFEQFAD